MTDAEQVESGADEPGDPTPDDAVEESVDSPVSVLKAPDEVVDPLRDLVEQRECRVLKRDVVGHLQKLSNAMVQAQNRAHAIVQEAKQEAEDIREEARQEGREQGYEELLDLIAQVRERYREVQDEARNDTMELAFRVARRIVGHKIEREPEVVADMVAKSLEHVRGKRQVVVHVNPADLPALEEERAALSEGLDGAAIYFEEAETIERGGCVIETETNRVDARLEVQLDRLREALTGR